MTKTRKPRRKKPNRRSSHRVANIAARVLDEGYKPTRKEVLAMAGSVVSQGRGRAR